MVWQDHSVGVIRTCALISVGFVWLDQRIHLIGKVCSTGVGVSHNWDPLWMRLFMLVKLNLKHGG